MEQAAILPRLARKVAREVVGRPSVWLHQRWHGSVPQTGESYTPFVIASPPRCGSTMLADQCDSHPQLVCGPEILGGQKLPRQKWLPEREWDKLCQMLAARPMRTLLAELWHRYPRRTKAVGFKLVYEQLDRFPTLPGDLAAMEDLKVIRLDRRGVLSRYVSAMRSLKSGHWHSRKSAPRADPTPMTIDVGELIDHLEFYDRAAQGFAATMQGRPFLNLWYEDLVAKPEESAAEICAFLDVPHRPLQATTRKLAPSVPIADQVQNMGEIQAALRGSPWEHRLF